jgi:hypothetical protein
LQVKKEPGFSVWQVRLPLPENSEFVNSIMNSTQERQMARRKPVNIATEGMYRKVGVVALGLALGAAFLGNDTTQTPAVARARASEAGHSAAISQRDDQVTDLADRDGPTAQDRDTEIGALIEAGSAAAPPEAAPDSGAPSKPEAANTDAGTRPSQAQIRALIEQSYARSGNDGGGD